MANPKKIAVYYPAFLGGGAETVGLWMLEALQQTYDLTLFTLAGVDFDRLNRLYGTTLSPERVTVKSLLPGFLQKAVNLLVANNHDSRQILFHSLLRYLKLNREAYDLLISAYNAIDFGVPGLQYVHWVRVLESNPRYNKISNFTPSGIQLNYTVVNSQMVADVTRKTYGLEVDVLYPPVVLEVTEIPWEQKEDAFICSGRLTPPKEPHKVIAILKQVRERGFDVKLHLTGGGGGIYPWGYANYIRRLAAEHADWITLYEDLSYEAYAQVLARCKYGIHFKPEPFGISVAEMVKAGALPFVKNRGGQLEIVGAHNQDLLFVTEKDAPDRIVEVLSDPAKQAVLHQSLRQQQALFSTQRFMAEFNAIVENCLAGRFPSSLPTVAESPSPDQELVNR